MRGSATGDAYARLSTVAARTSIYGAPNRPDALLFVDLDTTGDRALQCVRQLRDLPYSHFIGASRVVVRFPFDPGARFVSELAEVSVELERLLSQVAPSVLRSEVLEQSLGSPGMLHRAGAPPQMVDSALLWRLRGVELSAILESNHAVWSPSDYHFMLPSGAHIKSFVRVADGLSGPRDVHVLSTWILPHAGAGRGYVFDNRSLTPLAVMLESMHERAGVQPGPMTFLEHYPDTQFDVEAATQEAASGGGGVLGVLSVSSGGDTKARLLSAFDRAAQPASHLHVLLDRTQRPDAFAGISDTENVSTWLGFRHGDDKATSASKCDSCLTIDRRRVVAIDPRFFDGMVLPKPTLCMLAPGRAQAAAPFWEACDGSGAVAIEHIPSAATRSRRARVDDKSGRMGVFVSFERLLADETFHAAVVKATKMLLSRPSQPPEILSPTDSLKGTDLVVVGVNDADGESGRQFLKLLGDVLAMLPEPPEPTNVKVVDAAADPAHWDPAVIEALSGSKKVLIAGSGAVSGHSLQRLLIGCQEHLRKAEDPQPLAGLLLHARLETAREWSTLRNSFGLQLFALFETPLPSVSPLRREAQSLTTLRRDLRGAGETWTDRLTTFLDQRVAICNGDAAEVSAKQAASYVPLLWGLPATDDSRAHIRQHSLFGHKLGPAAYFAAVGSAVHRERQRISDEPGPVWQLFEMPALLRSYYDPLLIAAMLRWMEPSEIWWGDQAIEAVVSLLERSPQEDKAVLIPELLLAASHGKVPEQAAIHVDQMAERILKRPPTEYDDGVLVAIGAGAMAWRGERASRMRRSEARLEPLPEWPRSTS